MQPGGSPPSPDSLRQLSLTEALTVLDEAIVEAGQRLRDQAPPQLINGGKGLWVLRPGADDTSAYEVELLLAGRRVKAYTCTCGAFAKTHACDHLAALLSLVQLSKLPKASPVQLRSKASVNTKALLESIGAEELREFVAECARRDSELSLELRVRFAHLTNLTDRYAAVVDRLLVRQGVRYSSKELRRLHSALDHFASLRLAWLAQAHWLDLFEINTTLAERLVAVADKLVETRVDATAYVATLLVELTQVVDAKPAPVIVERVAEWLDGQRERGAYYRRDLDAQFYVLSRALGASRSEVIDEIETALDRFGESPARLRVYLDLLREGGRDAEARALLLRRLDEPQLVFDALETEVAGGRVDSAARLAEEAVSHMSDHGVRARLHRFIVAIGVQNMRPELILRHAPSLLLSTGTPAELLALADELPDAEAKTMRTALLSAVQQAQGRGGQTGDRPLGNPEVTPRQWTQAEADLLVQIGDGPALESLLYRTEHEHVILTSLPRLVGLIEPADVGFLLETKVREHLDRHLGESPAAYVTELLDAVARRDRTQLVPVLVARLRQTYSERHALLKAFKEAAF